MSKIDRWDIAEGIEDGIVYRPDTGALVEYADHVARMEEAQATIAQQAKMIEHLRGGPTPGYTAVDMTTAAAQGFRDGAASHWQSMATCPKHVDVLFFHERNGVIPGRLTDADSFMTDRERDELDASDEERFGIDAFGFGHWGVDRMEGTEAPSHWMPYPPEPEVKP